MSDPFNRPQMRSELSRDEGRRRSVYRDSLGYFTIGVGYLVDARRGGGASGASLGSSSQATIASLNSSCGGGEGEEAVFWLPAAVYTYTIAAGGSAGSAGTSGFAGAVGGSGEVDIEEFYN